MYKLIPVGLVMKYLLQKYNPDKNGIKRIYQILGKVAQ